MCCERKASCTLSGLKASGVISRIPRFSVNGARPLYISCRPSACSYSLPPCYRQQYVRGVL
jgi:hypothetical protein